MSDVIEIYSARSDQNIRDGELNVSYTIQTKFEAETDAIERCRNDKTIQKVAYYKVSPDGSFKMLHSYTNPDALTMVGNTKPRLKPDVLPRTSGKKPVQRKTKKKAGLMGRLTGALME